MRDAELEVHHDLFIARSPDQVWDFLLDQDGLKEWFKAREFIVDVHRGGELKFSIERSGQSYRIIGETGLLNHQKQLIVTWIEQDQFGRSWFTPTNVSFQSLPTQGGTLFRLIHNGFKYLPDEFKKDICQQYRTYWAEVALPQLKALVESS